MTPEVGDRISVLGWPSVVGHRIVACACADCAAGKSVAIDSYPGLEYRAVFPQMGARPQHWRARQVVAASLGRLAERRAEQLQLGLTP